MLSLGVKENGALLLCSAVGVMGDARKRWSREVILRSLPVSAQFESEQKPESQKYLCSKT